MAVPPPAPEPMFYTLNRRPKKKNQHDPTTRLAHNLEVDSRLKSAYGRASQSSPAPVSFLGETKNCSTSHPTDPANGHAVTHELEKQHARNLLSQTIGVQASKDKRLSNGVASPVSTRGEPTKEATTEPTGQEPPTADLISLSEQSPDTAVRLQGKGGTRAPDAKPARNVAESSEPPKAPGSSTSQREEQQLLEGGAVKEGRRPREVSPSDSEASGASSNELTPLIRKGSTSSSADNPFSPTEGEFEYVALGQQKASSETNVSWRLRSHSSSSEYDTLEKIQDGIAKRNSQKSVSPDDLAKSGTTGEIEGDAKLVSPPRAKINETPFTPPVITLRRDSRRSSSSSSDSIYDHLSPLPQVHEVRTDRDKESPPRIRTMGKIDFLPSPLDFSSVRRNVSQPALSTPGSARGSPSPSLEVGTVLEQSGSEFEEELTPTNSGDERSGDATAARSADHPVDVSNVVLRRKKRPINDPFADILSAPSGVHRLRWSQELNPLYDYIKGVKVSDSVSVDLRLYDTSRAQAAQGSSTPVMKKKPPSMIVEESEFSEVESVASSKDIDRSGSSASSYSQDSFAEASPSHCGVTGYSAREEDPLGCASQTLPRMRRPHAYEDVILEKQPFERPASQADVREGVSGEQPGLQRRTLHGSLPGGPMGPQDTSPKSMTMISLNARRLKTWDKPGALVISPRLGKRELQQRRSRTLACVDDTETVKRKQRAVSVKGPDELKVGFNYRKEEGGHFHTITQCFPQS